MKLITLVAALACVAAATATAALAAPRSTTIVGHFQDVRFGAPTSACPQETLFEIDFGLVSPGGDQLGTGISCVQGFVGAPCPEVAPLGCRQQTVATFVLTFAEGSITAPMTLNETFIGAGGLAQQGRGQITGGTRAYAGATGSIQDNGTFSVTAGAHLNFVVHID